MSKSQPFKEHRPGAPRPAADPTTPAPAPAVPTPDPGAVDKIPRHPDPTRYGDWEIGGRCVDF